MTSWRSGESTIIVLGEVWPGRTSLGLLLPNPPLRQVSPFTSVCVGGGGRGDVAYYAPPVVLHPPQNPQGLPVQAERVDTCLQTPVSASRTGGALSPPQKCSLHSPSRPKYYHCRPPSFFKRSSGTAVGGPKIFSTLTHIPTSTPYVEIHQPLLTSIPQELGKLDKSLAARTKEVVFFRRSQRRAGHRNWRRSQQECIQRSH